MFHIKHITDINPDEDKLTPDLIDYIFITEINFSDIIKL